MVRAVILTAFILVFLPDCRFGERHAVLEPDRAYDYVAATLAAGQKCLGTEPDRQ